MLYDWCINNMTVDELRNYAHYKNEVEEKYGELVYSKDEMIELLQKLCNSQQYMYSRLRALNNCRDRKAGFEAEMREKYEQFAPTPCCGTEEKDETHS